MKYVYIIAAFICLGISIWMGYIGKDAVMYVTGAAFFVLLFADRLVEFKVGKTGIEAKLKEVDEVVREAKATIKDLQQIAMVIGETTAVLVARSGRMDADFGDDERDDFVEVLESALRGIGLADQEISKVFWWVYRVIESDYASYVLGHPNEPENLVPGARKDWLDFMNRVSKDRPGPDEIEAYLVQYKLLDNDVRERLEDYKYYVANREHRRPDEWAKRHEVAPLKTLS